MRRGALLMALTLLVASPALAGGGVDFFGTYVSFEEAGEAFGGGVRVGWSFTEAFSADFAVTLLDDGHLKPSTGYTGDIQATPFDLGLKYRFANGLYVGGGVSYFVFNTENLDLDDESGYYGRFGFERVGPSGWGWFAEGLYRDFEADVGEIVDMSGPGVAAGATMKW